MTLWTGTDVADRRSDPSSPQSFPAKRRAEATLKSMLLRHGSFFQLKMVLRKLFPSAIFSTFLIDPPVGTMYFPLDLLS